MTREGVSLYYFKAASGNFGDDLNRWLWDRLLPNVFDDICYHRPSDHEKNNQKSILFVGIGTLLNQQVPPSPRKVVFTSGTGYGERPSIDDRWLFYAVRGPLTSAELGLPHQVTHGDGAMLLRFTGFPNPKERFDVSYIPHHKSASLEPWEEVCEDLGVNYIDSRAGVDEVLNRIAGSALVLTESLHGAIVADTYRVPWVAISKHPHINAFKWGDWCASIDVPYRPHRLPPMAPPSQPWDTLSAFRRSTRMMRQRRLLKRLISRASPLLSVDGVHHGVTMALSERLGLLKQDLATGNFDHAYRLDSG